jgi:hypothetical protein
MVCGMRGCQQVRKTRGYVSRIADTQVEKAKEKSDTQCNEAIDFLIFAVLASAFPAVSATGPRHASLAAIFQVPAQRRGSH